MNNKWQWQATKLPDQVQNKFCLVGLVNFNEDDYCYLDIFEQDGTGTLVVYNYGPEENIQALSQQLPKHNCTFNSEHILQIGEATAGDCPCSKVEKKSC